MKQLFNILIVDDQFENIRIIRKYIEDTKEPYNIFTALNGHLALEITSLREIDLVITDWQMPIMNGIQLLNTLKGNPVTADIPVIIITGAMLSPDDIRTALEAGAHDYIRKPVERVELIARMKSMLKINSAYKQMKLQKQEIEEKSRLINESINYAGRIQKALLNVDKAVHDYFADYFILWQPREIVSGDFYWIKKINNRIIIAAADCTGHGVPGAFVSMLGIALLNEIIPRNDYTSISEVLEILRKKFITALHQNDNNSEVWDGMDIAICEINTETLLMQYSGANNPIFLIRNNELVHYQPTKSPIGGYLVERPFELSQIQLQKDDSIYLFSDGFMDQPGGESGERFKMSRFKELISKVSQKPMNEQHQIITKVIADWISEKHQQLDDILIIGLKI